MSEVDDVIKWIRNALETGNIAAMQAAIVPFTHVALEGDGISDELFDFLEGTLRSEALAGFAGAQHFVYLLSSEWETFTDSQAALLLIAMEDAFPNLNEWVAQFTIVDLIAREYPNADGLRVLTRFSKVSNPMGRAVAAAGLGILAENTSSPNIRTGAEACIREMTHDEVHDVRTEATDALRKLSSN